MSAPLFIQETEKEILDVGVSKEKLLCVLGSIEEGDTQKRLIEETVEKFGKLDVLVSTMRGAVGQNGVEGSSKSP